MIISKDEKIKESTVYCAYLILQLFKKRKAQKILINEVFDYLRIHNINKYRQIIIAICFLFMTGAVDYKDSFLYKNAKN